jgi:phage terminase large subunit-like protein
MLDSLSYSEKLELAQLMERRDQLIRSNKLRDYRPYAKQREFHENGATFRERLFMAGNQLGKTYAGAAEAAMHLTGRYPDWWKGRRFDSAITMLAGSESYELTRDGVQRLLVGPPMTESEWGTGYIPKEAIVGTTRRSGVSGALDTVTVKHASGGTSTLLLKAYEQGRGKWQANTVEFVWFDEEPPEDVYFEGITRTNATGGSIAVTFTPLKGMSAVVARYVLEDSEDRAVISMTIEDAEHYTPAERAKIIASYPPHEREARTKGIPSLGSGLVFPVMEEDIVVEPFDIPAIWPQIVGIDFGYDHPFGAVRLAHDRDNDVVYVTAEYRKREAGPVVHSAAIKPWGSWIPVAWPHDGMRRDKDPSGKEFKSLYEDQGLNMLPEMAEFEGGGYGREAGLMDMLDRMETGRWKVFKTCVHWLEERRMYHRKDGVVVDERDDVLCASRYALMMLRFAETHRAGVMPQVDNDWVR